MRQLPAEIAGRVPGPLHSRLSIETRPAVGPAPHLGQQDVEGESCLLKLLGKLFLLTPLLCCSSALGVKRVADHKQATGS